MASQRTRFYLTGRVGIDGMRLIDQAELPGRQGRLALVHLVVERHRPVPIDALAAALWGSTLPRTWETSLRAVVSKLRRALATADPDAAIVSDAGCYQAMLGDAWVDVEVAANAVDRAEGAWRRRDRAVAWSEATVAAGIAGRPVLPGDDQPWVGELRGQVRSCRVRALSILAEVYLADEQLPLAVSCARQLVELEPYRESGYRQLMRAHLAGGDRGEAVRVHAVLRSLLGDELGVDPSPETQALYLEAMQSGGPGT